MVFKECPLQKIKPFISPHFSKLFFKAPPYRPHILKFSVSTAHWFPFVLTLLAQHIHIHTEVRICPKVRITGLRPWWGVGVCMPGFPFGHSSSPLLPLTVKHDLGSQSCSLHLCVSLDTFSQYFCELGRLLNLFCLSFLSVKWAWLIIVPVCKVHSKSMLFPYSLLIMARCTEDYQVPGAVLSAVLIGSIRRDGV